MPCVPCIQYGHVWEPATPSFHSRNGEDKTTGQDTAWSDPESLTLLSFGMCPAWALVLVLDANHIHIHIHKCSVHHVRVESPVLVGIGPVGMGQGLDSHLQDENCFLPILCSWSLPRP